MLEQTIQVPPGLRGLGSTLVPKLATRKGRGILLIVETSPFGPPLWGAEQVGAERIQGETKIWQCICLHIFVFDIFPPYVCSFSSYVSICSSYVRYMSVVFSIAEIMQKCVSAYFCECAFRSAPLTLRPPKRRPSPCKLRKWQHKSSGVLQDSSHPCTPLLTNYAEAPRRHIATLVIMHSKMLS